mgnify:FL=1
MSGQDSNSSKVDLSSVPEPMRTMLLKQLDKMPASLREQLLRDGSPMLDRLIAKAREHASAGTASLPASAAESASVPQQARLQTVRNVGNSATTGRTQTVSPGDSASHGPFLLAAAVALAGAVWYALQG